MIRARFYVEIKNELPVVEPIMHPYWCVGFGPRYLIMISYADSLAALQQCWPTAWGITSQEVTQYEFSEYTPKPAWLK